MKIKNPNVVLIPSLIVLAALFIAFMVLTFCDPSCLSSLQTSEQIKSLSNEQIDYNYKGMVIGIAIVLSVIIAVLFSGYVIKNDKDTERKRWTLKVLQQDCYTLAWMRDLQQDLETFYGLFKKVLESNNKDEFNDVIEYIRRSHLYVNVIKTLDCYQQLAVGIDRMVFDRDIARALCGTTLLFLYSKTSSYIDCRENFDQRGLASGDVYRDFRRLAESWDEPEWCDLRKRFATDDDKILKLIKGFKSEFKANKRKRVVLVVKGCISGIIKWIVAGFNDKGIFIPINIDKGNPLTGELEAEDEVLDKRKVADLATSLIGRSKPKVREDDN